MTPDLQAAVERIAAWLDADDPSITPDAVVNEFDYGGDHYELRHQDLRALLTALDPAAHADHIDDSTQIHAALTAEPLTLEDTDAIRRTRDYLGVHLRVHGPDAPIATIDDRAGPGGFLWALTPADLARTLVPAIPHTTYEGMQALRGDPAEAPIGHVPTEAGTAAVIDYRAIRRQQQPRGGEEA